MEMSFKLWLNEDEAQPNQQAQAKAAAAKLQKALQGITPERMQAGIKSLGIDPEDLSNPETRTAAFAQLTKALESHPRIAKVKASYEKSQQQMPEWVLEESFWGVVNVLTKPIQYLAKKAMETIAHVFEPVPLVGGLIAKAFAPWRELEKDIGHGRVQYTGMLMITFLLSPMLLAGGIATANPGMVAAGVAAIPVSAAWWYIMLFGKAVLEPFLKWTDPGSAPAYA